ncbi:hypothetical protein [Amycolatopsis alkalitolerans]|nr:hypothetical protein [Amycolatopsis alkalitolerans]
MGTVSKRGVDQPDDMDRELNDFRTGCHLAGGAKKRGTPRPTSGDVVTR